MASSTKTSHDLVALEGADPMDDRYTRREEQRKMRKMRKTWKKHGKNPKTWKNMEEAQRVRWGRRVLLLFSNERLKSKEVTKALDLGEERCHRSVSLARKRDRVTEYLEILNQQSHIVRHWDSPCKRSFSGQNRLQVRFWGMIKPPYGFCLFQRLSVCSLGYFEGLWPTAFWKW